MGNNYLQKYTFETPLIKGSFLERINRFTALVEINSKVETIFVPNTGRMKELLVKGAKVLLTLQEEPHRKTKYDLSLVDYANRWVSIDSRLPNKLFEFWWSKGYLKPFLKYQYLKKEVVCGKSRLDFRLTRPDGDCYVEVKSVTLVEGGIALFPDAPTVRGTRHLLELTKVKQGGSESSVVFLIQRDDAVEFRPNDHTDKTFGLALRDAVLNGVKAYAFMCSIDAEGITFKGQVPVMLN